MSVPQKIYFISEHSYQELIHGGVGPVDIETILTRNNAVPIRFPHHFNFSIRAKIARLVYLLKTGFSVDRNAVIVFQHPLYARMNKILLQLLRLRKFENFICIVADIDGLKGGNKELLQNEQAFFLRYKYFILHNSGMLRWFQTFHPGATVSLLSCFDFLTNAREHQRLKTNHIVFAGNLQKSTFLENLHTWMERNPSLYIDLYGPHIADRMLISSKVAYKGLHSPYALPDVIQGSFGLIWDGESIERPEGSLGDYMQYINHHKLSLYIVCNLPIIVHEDTGSAELIRKFNIGFTIKSLFDVEYKIEELSEHEYGVMVSNTRELAKEITSGNCLQKALGELLSKIEEKAR